MLYPDMADILNTIFNTRELSIFATAIKVTSLDKVLTGDCDFTIFAPNNLAFSRLSNVNPHILTDDIWLLTEILSIHMIPGNLTYQDLLRKCKSGERETLVTSLDSSQIGVNLRDGIVVGNSTVLSTDTSPRNGILHLIDRVMMPAP